MLDEWRAPVPHSWATGDDELGCHTRFRHERRDLEAPLSVYPGRGRRPKAPWHSVTEWRQCLDAEAWTYLTMRDGEKGLAIEMVKRRGQTRIERKLTRPEEWLVASRRPLSDDWTFEPHTSRDATERPITPSVSLDLVAHHHHLTVLR